MIVRALVLAGVLSLFGAQAGAAITGHPANAAATASENSAAAFDLIVAGGKVIDGTGNGWFYADVGVRDGRIVSIGDLRDVSAKRRIDAKGLVVAPGFIDVHTHTDDGLYDLPRAENFIRDGVTTVVAGNCGGSVRDVAAYFRDLQTTGTAVNVATLVGHNTILNQVKGDTGAPLNAEQMERAKALLRQAMRDGAVGMSTGLIYTPGKYSKTEEIVEMQQAVAEMGGMYATHMRSESTEILDAIDEALRVGRETDSRVQISHFKIPMDNAIGGSATTLKKVLDARAQGQEVWLDQYPYTASSTGISTLLPDWVLEGGREAGRKILADPEQLPRVFADFKAYQEGVRHRTDFAWATLASCRAYPGLTGKSILEASRRLKFRETHPDGDAWLTAPVASLPEVTMDDQYRTIIDIHLKGGASCVFHTMAEDDVKNIMRCPLVAVASDSGVRRFGSGTPHPRGYGTNARVLGRYVREQGVISIEDAVRKMTGLPALEFRFLDRGLIRPGYRADVTLFDPEKVIDRATFENPHQYPDGIPCVIVNGEVVLENSEFTGALPGRPIYGPAHTPETPSGRMR